jgi:hypothetical protein
MIIRDSRFSFSAPIALSLKNHHSLYSLTLCEQNILNVVHLL